MSSIVYTYIPMFHILGPQKLIKLAKAVLFLNCFYIFYFKVSLFYEYVVINSLGSIHAHMHNKFSEKATTRTRCMPDLIMIRDLSLQ